VLLAAAVLGERRGAAAVLRGVEQADVAGVQQDAQGVLERLPDRLRVGGRRRLAREAAQGWADGVDPGFVGGEQRFAAFYLRLLG